MKIDFTPLSKKLILDFRPRVYLRAGTHTYLWLRDGRAYGYFLTMESGTIKIVKIERIEDGIYRVYESADMWWDLGTYEPYDFQKAVGKYHSSLLARTDRAEEEMRKILDLPKMAPREAQPNSPDESIGKTARAPREEKPEKPKTYSLAELCDEIKIDPSAARKLLRGKVEKPGGKWEWPNAKAALPVRAILMQGQL